MLFRHLFRSTCRSTAFLVSPARRNYVSKFDLPDPKHLSYNLTKIVATIGPTSEQLDPLKLCVQAGMNVMRLNFSHATPEEVQLRVSNLQTVAPKNPVAIMLDTKGPELRSGKLLNDVSGHDTIDLEAGDSITVHKSPTTLPETGSTKTDLLIEFAPLNQVLEIGRHILLDDGAVVLQVSKINHDHGTVICKILNSNSLRSRAGVNLPLADTAQYLPALSEKDKADIEYGMKYADIDFVAASFVQTAQHVKDIRQHCEMLAQRDFWNNKPVPKIISKIETATALQHFDEILNASDGIMVARGDLGVEIPLTQVTNAQKEMIKACNKAGKAVIVATQMMESMSKNIYPTRAEVADVTNAVWDGADCVMLSGESAKGKQPSIVISTMRDINKAAEYAIGKQKSPVDRLCELSTLAKAAVTVADADHADIFVVTDATMAGFVSSHRPDVPIVVECENDKIARQVQIHRGVYPVVGNNGLSFAQETFGYKVAVLVDTSSIRVVNV